MGIAFIAAGTVRGGEVIFTVSSMAAFGTKRG